MGFGSNQPTQQRVKPYNTLADFPIIGKTEFIYIDKSVPQCYLWSVAQNAYVTVGQSGGVGDLQQVTDIGATTDNECEIQGARLGADTTDKNTTFGYEAALNNTDIENTSIGHYAGKNNGQPGQTAVGYSAGLENNGTYQTAVGNGAGLNNTGDVQTAIGFYSGSNNTGINQTAIGYGAGQENIMDNQTAVGFQAGISNEGLYQTAVGKAAGQSNTGNFVTIIGAYNNSFINYNTFNNVNLIGCDAIATANNQTVLAVIGNDIIIDHGIVLDSGNLPYQMWSAAGVQYYIPLLTALP